MLRRTRVVVSLAALGAAGAFAAVTARAANQVNSLLINWPSGATLCGQSISLTSSMAGWDSSGDVVCRADSTGSTATATCPLSTVSQVVALLEIVPNDGTAVLCGTGGQPFPGRLSCSAPASISLTPGGPCSTQTISANGWSTQNE
jgi:hypothetical protein